MANLKFGQKISLKTYYNKYLSARTNGDLTAAPRNPGPYEMFTLVKPGAPNDQSDIRFGDKIALLGHHGQYVVAERNGSTNANRTAIGEWEQFTIIKPSDPPIRAISNPFGGFPTINSNPDPGSRDIVKITDGFALGTHHNTYLNGDDHGVCRANATDIGAWEQFFGAYHQDESPSGMIQFINETGESVSLSPRQPMMMNRLATQRIDRIEFDDLGTTTVPPRIPFDTIRLTRHQEDNQAPDTIVYEYDRDGQSLAKVPDIPVDGSRRVRFMATADPQIFKDMPGRNEVARQVMFRSWGRVFQNPAEYFGFLVAGDLTQMAIQTEWEYYRDIAKVMEVYDGWGNHDVKNNWTAWTLGDRDRDHEILQHIRDSKRRFPCHGNSAGHYSWDWRDVHFVNVNLYPGTSADAEKIDPQDSLQFLTDDLKSRVGDSGRPVVIMQHYGFDQDVSIDGEWWTATERANYWDAIADYNVIMIISGHIHNHNDGHVEWLKPASATKNTKYPRGNRQIIHNVIAGGACMGYYMDIEILKDKINILRYVDGDNRQSSFSLNY